MVDNNGSVPTQVYDPTLISPIEALDSLQVFGSQLKVEDIDIGDNPVFCDTLGNDGNSTFHLKPDQYLSTAFVVLLSDLFDFGLF